MSRGWLHFLATRAIGVEPRLRSQRTAMPPALQPEVDFAASDDAPRSPPIGAEQEHAAPRPAQGTSAPDVDMVVHLEGPRDRPSVPIVSPAARVATAVASVHQTPVEKHVRDLARPAPSTLADLPPTQPSPSTAAAPFAAPHDRAERPAPAPLLPLSTIANVARDPARPLSTRRERAGPARETQAPTEVHVSIGRIELTALPLAPAIRATTRRERVDNQSLADYLRGATAHERPPK